MRHASTIPPWADSFSILTRLIKSVPNSFNVMSWPASSWTSRMSLVEILACSLISVLLEISVHSETSRASSVRILASKMLKNFSNAVRTGVLGYKESPLLWCKLRTWHGHGPFFDRSPWVSDKPVQLKSTKWPSQFHDDCPFIDTMQECFALKSWRKTDFTPVNKVIPVQSTMRYFFNLLVSYESWDRPLYVHLYILG